MTQTVNRRSFIRSTLTGSTALLAAPYIARTKQANARLQVGFIAAGGRAGAHTQAASRLGLQCIAFAEVDKSRWGGVLEKPGWSEASGYTDWREMFTRHGDDLDVVFVSTPDHTHFAPSMTALSMGIHCYTEKPLTWSVREAQLLTQAYARNPEVVTQMGNQGHAGSGWRTAYDYVQAGALGDIQEFHTWTDRPRWPQGGTRPDWSDPVPPGLDWEAWIGPAPMRPYAEYKPGRHEGLRGGVYHGFKWRGFVDFGSGALGDMACHTTDGIYAIMDPGYAATIEPVYLSDPVKDQWPAGMVVKATYRPQATRPGFSTFWYEGCDKDGEPLMPAVPEELLSEGKKLPRTGNLVVGSKSKMLVTGDYWNSARLIPDRVRREVGRVEKLLPSSPGHHEEFLMACRGEKPRAFSQSNFSYSGPMTANIQLGNLCARVAKKIELNEQGDITSDATVNDLAWREPRAGWGPLTLGA